MADIDADKVQILINNALISAAQASKQAEAALAEAEPFVLMVSENSRLMDNDSMSSITRDEINAKLEATEARMDARVAGMSSKLDTALAEMRADREITNVRFAAMAKDIGDIKGELSGTKAQFRTVVGNVWGASVATVTIVAAIVGFGISAFDSGRETSKSIAEATVRMEKLQTQLEAQAKAGPAPQR